MNLGDYVGITPSDNSSPQTLDEETSPLQFIHGVKAPHASSADSYYLIVVGNRLHSRSKPGAQRDVRAPLNLPIPKLFGLTDIDNDKIALFTIV